MIMQIKNIYQGNLLKEKTFLNKIFVLLLQICSADHQWRYYGSRRSQTETFRRQNLRIFLLNCTFLSLILKTNYKNVSLQNN